MKKKSLKLLHIIEILFVLLVVAVFILSNPTTLKYLSNTLTKSYDISYTSLSGNLLTNIKIKDLKYQNKTIAKEADVEFNLLKLLLLDIEVSSLKLSKVDMANLRYFILKNIDQNKTKTQQNSSINLPITLSLHNIYFDILPYNKQDLKISKLSIYLKKFKLSNSIKADNLNVKMQSNFFKLKYQGSYDSGNLHIKELFVKDLDIKRVLSLRDILKSDSNSSNSIIRSIKVDRASLSIKPYRAKKYKISSLELKLKEFDLQNQKLFANSVDLKIDTNIWKLSSKGDINNSIFTSKVKVELDDKYFKKFIPDLNFRSLNPIDVRLKIDKDKLIGDLQASSNQLLDKRLKDLDLKLKSLKTHAIFLFDGLNLHFTTDANLSSKYISTINLNGDFYYSPKKSISYNGHIDLAKLKNFDKRAITLLKDTKIEFAGDKSGIQAKATSKYITANYNSKKSYLTPSIDIVSKQFNLNELDANLSKDIKASFIVESKLNYKDIKSSTINYQINSNAINIDGDYSLKNALASVVLSLPKDSILVDKKVDLKPLFPINSTIKVAKDLINVDAKGDLLELNAEYDLLKKLYNAKIKLPDTNLHLKSVEKDSIEYSLNTLSLKNLTQTINKIYPLPDLHSDGEINVTGSYKDATLKFDINSRWFLNEYSKYKYFFLENTNLTGSFANSTIKVDSFNSSAYILDRYRRLFSNKTSTIEFKDKKALLSLHLNNSINIEGYAGEDTKIKISSPSYHIYEPEADIYIALNLNYQATKYLSSLQGRLKLLRGTIKYKPKKLHDINDKDIIFVNKKKKLSSSNTDLSLKITTQRAIKYKQGSADVDFLCDLTLLKKPKKQIKGYGDLTILEGVYISDNKKFSLGKGKILFAGDLLNPYLELKAYYTKDPYNITILVGGQLDSPTLNFSSSPYLSQNDILSILLFNTKASSLTNSNSSSNPALSLFGSTFAKGILNTLGVKLDRVEILTTKDGGIGFELEKRVGRRTTIIYQNDLVQTIKLRYQNSKHIETDLTFSPDSSSIDIIFKNEK